MEQFRKIATLILLCAMLLAMFSACTTTKNEIVVTTEAEEDTSTEEPDFRPVTIREPADLIVLLQDGKSDYTIVRAENATPYEREMATLFLTTFHALTGVVLPIADDYESATEKRQDKEIIIGRTNREDEYMINESDIQSGFSVFVSGERLVFVGGNKGMLYLAIRSFFLNQFDYDIDLALPTTPSVNNLIFAGTYISAVRYSCKEMPFMKTALSDYEIDYSISNGYLSKSDGYIGKRMAYLIAEALRESSGVLLPRVETDEPAKAAFVLSDTLSNGETLESGKFHISVSGNRVLLCASDYYGYMGISAYLKKMWSEKGLFAFGNSTHTDISGDYRTLLDSSNATNAYADDRQGTTRVMFWNTLWQDYAGPSIYIPRSERDILQEEVVAKYLPDVLGCQEFGGAGGRRNENGLADRLAALGYVEACDPYVNIEQDQFVEGSVTTVHYEGDICTPIFYRPSVLRKVDSGFLWYRNQANIGVGDQFSKAMSWAVFEEKSTGFSYAVISTHLCTQSAVIGGKQAEEALAKINEIIGKYHCPVFIGGDMNAYSHEPFYNVFIDAGLKDARLNATISSGTVGSHHEYGNYNESAKMILPSGGASSTLDYIFVANGDKIDLNLFGTVVDTFTAVASDHNPIYIDVGLPEITPSDDVDDLWSYSY